MAGDAHPSLTLMIAADLALVQSRPLVSPTGLLIRLWLIAAAAVTLIAF
jgi:hypothetical protein